MANAAGYGGNGGHGKPGGNGDPGGKGGIGVMLSQILPAKCASPSRGKDAAVVADAARG